MQKGFDIGEERFPQRPVGSYLFYTYKDTGPFPRPTVPNRVNREHEGIKKEGHSMRM